ncbi:glycosyltransferase family 4 protein [Breznakiella homolactica]|uniref:Glycosyltransferase family 4 protein n=1 Tax=Breznakiella homolactica TaxID=2798577 RepID=A0A7T7XJQ1_9SPIR|nr:glycosyltransferase family 1 protein [Breznakiella homolactica]QQO07508.1 glycosyltransferase family 4 protein [Breznakiella homolactica]
MKIGIDTFDCDGGKSGVGVYLMQLLKRIPPSGDRYELFGWDYDRYSFSDAAGDLEFIPQCFVNGRTANSLWHLFRYPKFASSRGYNACFFPSAHRRLPGSSPCPTIGTVHDMAAYWGTRQTREHLGAVLRMVLPNSLRKLDRIIAVSSWVKQELVDVARVKEAKVEVIPNGIDLDAFYPRPRNEESVVLIQPFSFRRPYILYVSRIDYPVKNHIRLIEAFGIFKERTRHPHRLVLAGSDRNGADKVKAAAAKSKYRNDIFFTGHFPSKNLPELYSGADFAVFPSMYEGFGMGVLEAMASGVPVACARAASLPEVADHAALYFDPADAEDMADRMVTLTTKRDIYRECRALGLQQAQNFSWDRCAERTLKLIHETAGR